MKEGWWINYRTGKSFEINEHERWLRELGNAGKLGVPSSVVAMFGKFISEKDRDKFLLFVMQNAPVMRVRGHGSYASFEYSSRERQAPMEAVAEWGGRNAGPFTSLNIVNFATKEDVQTTWQDFERTMDEGGAEAVLRVAGKVEMRAGVVRELLRLSKELLEGKE